MRAHRGCGPSRPRARRRHRVSSGRSGRGRSARRSRCGHLADLRQLGLGRSAFGAEAVEFALLILERLLRVGERLDRGVLARLRVGEGLVGLPLGHAGRRIAIDLLSAGAHQVVDRLTGTDGERLPGGGGVDDLARIVGGEVGRGRAVHVGRRRELVEPLLRGGDCGVGLGEGRLARLHFAARLVGGFPGGLHADECLVDVLLLGLDLTAEVLQLLIGIGDFGHQRGNAFWAARFSHGDPRAVAEHRGDEDSEH